MKKLQILATIEGACAGILIWFGGFVLNPYIDSFAPNRKIFEPMTNIAPEFVWGLFYLICGLISMVLLFNQKERAAKILISAALISISALFFMGDYRSYGFGIYLILSIGNLIKWRLEQWNSIHFNG